MTKLIGLTGRAQHGKDTAGALLVEEYGFTQLAFADSLREAVWTLNPWVQYREPPANEIIDYRTALTQYGYEEAKKLPEVRRLLQVMGTEVGRNIFGQDCWVQAAALKMNHEERTVITDVRFPNEAAFIRQNGGKVIRIRRLNLDDTPFDNGIGREHPSEMYVDSLPVDYEFDAWDINGLQAAVRTIADYETGRTNDAEANA